MPNDQSTEHQRRFSIIQCIVLAAQWKQDHPDGSESLGDLIESFGSGGFGQSSISREDAAPFLDMTLRQLADGDPSA